MTSIKVSELNTAATPYDGSEYSLGIQDNRSVKIPVPNLAGVAGASLVGVTPTGTISATTVAGALTELDIEKATVASVALKANSADLSASTGATLVGFQQTGAGVVARTVDAKLKENLSVLDFGAVGDGTTNNLTAIQNAIAAAGSNPIKVPIDSAGGNYAITSGTLTIPATANFIYEGASRIYASGGVVTKGGSSANLLNDLGGVNIETRTPRTSPGVGGSTSYNSFAVFDDQIVTPGKVDGLKVVHYFGGSSVTGGRHAGEVFLIQNANKETSSSNPDRNYAGWAMSCWTYSGDGGVAGSPKGGYFGGNFSAMDRVGGKHILNLSGVEVNTLTAAGDGNSVAYHSGVQIAPRHYERGYNYDCALGISRLGVSTVTWEHGILMGNMNGDYPFDTTSTAIEVNNGATSIANLLVGPTCTTNILKSGDVTLTNNSFSIYSTTPTIELGALASVNTPHIDFHTSGNNIDYDSRIFATGGSSTIGQGNITFNAANLTTSANVNLTGNVGIGGNATAGIAINCITPLSLATQFGVRCSGPIQADNNLAGVYNQTVASSINSASPYTTPSIYHYQATQGTFGTNSTITNQFGFAAGATLIGATNNYGFYGAIPAATGRYNFYAAGTAANFFAGDMQFGKTVTAIGTTGAVTIDKTCGTANFAAAATSLIVTNALVTANSIIICTVGTVDTTLKSVVAVAATGSFTMTANAAATGTTRVNFLVIN